MIDIEFMIVGYRNDRGYGVKDIKDGKVEYFNREQVLSMSRCVKIYGVDGGKIDSDWFRAYYAKYVMSYGLDSALQKFRLRINSENKFEIYNSGCSSDFNFIEFVESIDLKDKDTVYYVFKHLDYSDSTLFHLNGRVNKIDGIGLIGDLNRFDIRNILCENGMITCGYNSTSCIWYIDGLGMHNIVYNLRSCLYATLINVPSYSKVIITFSSEFNSKLFVKRNCDLSNVEFGLGSYFPESVYLEDMSDAKNVSDALLRSFGNKGLVYYRLKYRSKIKSIKFKSCEFIKDSKDNTFGVRYEGK